MVERLNPLGLNGIKITLDGDREAHNQARPLRGGQGTFDKIIANTRAVADLTRIAVGGNFEADTVEAYPALLDFLAAQDFAPKLSKVSFKPVIREKKVVAKGMIPLTVVSGDGKPLGGACMTSAGTGVSRACDSCDVADDKTAYLREETKKRGFKTADGVLWARARSTRARTRSVPMARSSRARASRARRCSRPATSTRARSTHPGAQELQKLAAWEMCNDCAFIPVCAEAARSRRTTSWATCTPPTVTNRVSKPA
jgi:uncharacterized protein